MNTEEKAEGQEVKVEELTPAERELIAAKMAQEKADADRIAARKAAEEAQQKINREKHLREWKRRQEAGGELIRKIYKDLRVIGNEYQLEERQVCVSYQRLEDAKPEEITTVPVISFTGGSGKIKVVAVECYESSSGWRSHFTEMKLKIDGLGYDYDNKRYKSAKTIHRVITEHLERHVSRAKQEHHRKTALEAGLDKLRRLYPTALVTIVKEGRYTDTWKNRNWISEEVLEVEFPNGIAIQLKPNLSPDQPISFSLYKLAKLGKLASTSNILLLLDTLGALEVLDEPR